LFAPACDDRKLASALASGAEAVIADLEDAVAHNRKEEARTRAARFAEEHAAGPWRIVRINDPRTPTGQADLEALATLRLDAVMVPKATTESVDLVLERAARVVALIETARGVKEAEALAGRVGVVAVALGTIDLAAEMGLRALPDGDELLHVRSRLVLDCTAAGGVPAIDGAFATLGDVKGLAAEVARGLALGFSAKLCVHPRQLEVVASGFSPSPDQLARARRIVDAYCEATSRGIGAVRLDGELVDLASVRWARRVLATDEENE
jgi:citrate lyase subunit beta/citryl-CoA lyase